MVFPYLSRDALAGELPYRAEDVGVDDVTEDDNGDTAWDRLLDRLLAAESERVEALTGTHFEERSTTETLDGNGSTELPLDNRPIQAVTALTVRDPDGGDVNIGSDGVYVYETHLLLADDADVPEFYELPRNVEVTYSFGHASETVDDVPHPVREAVLRLVRARLARIEEDGLERESVDGASYTYRPPEDLTREIAVSLREFRAPRYSPSGGVEVI